MDKHIAGRTRSGYTTVNPRLHRKLADQKALRDRVMFEIDAAIDKATTHDLQADILRYASVGLVKTAYLNRDGARF